MSLSLIGIIIVQVYWINTSLKKSEEEFKLHIQQVLGNVTDIIQNKEFKNFVEQWNFIKDSTGVDSEKNTLKEYLYMEKDKKTNETIIYTSTIIAENYGVNVSFFDKKYDSLDFNGLIASQKTEVYNADVIESKSVDFNKTPDLTIETIGNVSLLDKANFLMYFEKISELRQINERISKEEITKYLKNELNKYQIVTPFEYAIYSNGLATKIRSDEFKYDKKETYGIPVFQNEEGISQYQLLVSFPQKAKFFFSSILIITFLSILFTFIIVITYLSALNQLIKQRQISEIKTDFINNMTHEFKTPIATINLALDAIRNPKIINDTEKVQRYLQMIKDENKRMLAQVENVLRISRLEKNELDILKEPTDVVDILNIAVDHVSLIVENRMGIINTHLNAKRTTILLNDVHFTNVLVNILDNAVKYSVDEPVIDIYTENVNNFILIKIVDQGAGMSKVAQKRVFEKFYREHTGDVHNVKGHGLGLAYVKQIVEDHNGQIVVESEKGKGSTFILKMPLIN
jgi:two-component system phosphate regulon sensor histidine kinase PhoR